MLSSTSYTPDGNGNVSQQNVMRTLPDGTSQNMITLYFYDAQNRVVRTREPDNFFSTNIYNSIGQQQHTIDKLGRTSTFEYDTQGRMFKHTYPDETFELSFYDAEGRRTNSVDRAGRAKTYVYDKLGRVMKTIFADSATSETVFDPVGRVSYTIDARGTTNAFGYDDAGRRIAVTNAFGASIQATNRYNFDRAGNLTNMVDALGRAIDYEYDALNRQVRTIYPATVLGGPRAVTLTGYDVLGQKIAETNEADIVTCFGYDGLGRLVSVTNAHGTTNATWATYAYDEAGNQTNQMDALDRMTRYEFDDLGRRIRRILPGGQKESFVYDPVGNLLRHTNFINTLVITNEYDSMNRLLRKWSGSTLLESYAYTASGQRASRTDESGSYAWVYDLRDRVRTNSTPVGALYYGYDRNGNLTNLLSSTPNGVSIAYQYDALNRVTNAVDNRLTGTKNTAYSFDLAGNLKTLKYPNAVTDLWEYDSRNRLTNEVWKHNATTLASFYYQLAVTGNRTNLSEVMDSASRTYSWWYDKLYRLTNETIGSFGGLAYGYDLVSNRTNRSGTLGPIGSAWYGYNNNDWLTNDTYDAKGNTVSSGGVSYAYDWANRLTNAGSISMVYNTDSHRIKKTSATTTTLYLVDERNLTGYPRVVEELTVSGSVTNLSRVYAYGLALISQRQSDGTLHFYGYDGHGSTSFLLNGSGGITDSYAYDAYGTLIASNGSTVNAYLYTGEQFDSDVGVYLLGARQMNPNTGRFLTMDSFQGNQLDPLSLQKYLYGHADPVNNTDPSGKMSVTERGTRVHTFLGKRWESQDPRFGVGLGGRRWGNRQVRTIAYEITGIGHPNWWPWNIKPDLTEIDSPKPQVIPATKGYIFEIKPGILSLANGGLLAHEIMDTTIQLAGYFILNTIMSGGYSDFWERGRLDANAKVQVWQDFPYNPPGHYLVTLDISDELPGVIVYEFFPTQEALQYALAGATVGLGVAAAERYGISAAVSVTVRTAIRAGGRVGAAYLQLGLQVRTAMGAMRF